MSSTAEVRFTESDLQLTEYLAKVRLSTYRRERLRADGREHPGDERLRSDRAYDAETARLLEQIREARQVVA